jgi:ribosomal protein L30E
MICNDIWKDIIGYEGLYKISNTGKVKSLKRYWITGHNTNRFHDDFLMKTYIDKDGYECTCLCKNGKRKGHKIHRLVLISFKGYSELQCNHIDGNKLNNNIDNLEYVTSKENIIHACNNNLRNYAKGNSHYNAKLTEYKVKEILSSNKEIYKILAKKYNISMATLMDVVNRKTWKHIGI